MLVLKDLIIDSCGSLRPKQMTNLFRLDFAFPVCRLLQEQMEQSLSDAQHRLSVKTMELQKAHQQIGEFEERLGKSPPHSC